MARTARARGAEVGGPGLAAVAVQQAAGGFQRGRPGRDERAERREARVAGRPGDVDVAAAAGPDVQARAARRAEGGESHEPDLLGRPARHHLVRLRRARCLDHFGY